MKIRTADQFKKARLKQGLTLKDTAALMLLPNPEISGYETVARWERIGRVPGPAMSHMETLATGWRPAWWKDKK